GQATPRPHIPLSQRPASSRFSAASADRHWPFSGEIAGQPSLLSEDRAERTSCTRARTGAGSGGCVTTTARYRPKIQSVFDEGLQLLRSTRVAELAEGLRLDLADALARHFEVLTDLFEGVV